MLRLRPIWLLSLLTLLAATAFDAPPVGAELPDWRFGLIESYEAPEAATEAGAAWTRVLFHWKYVEADGPGQWEPPVDDAQLARELAEGRQVVGLLIGLPEWAADEAGLPQGLWLPPADPDTAIPESIDPMDERENELADGLAPAARDVVFDKYKPSVFFGTQLESMLRVDGVETVIVTGMTTSGCVRATAVDAFSYNYNVVVPVECVADRSQVSHEVTLFDLDTKYADVVSLEELLGTLDG